MKKKKIIKAQLGRIVKDNLSPQQRMQLDTYKKTVVDEMSNKERDRRNQDQEDSYRNRINEYQAQREISRMPRQDSPMEESSRMPMDRNPMDEAYYIMKKRYDEQMLSPSSSVQERKKGGMTKAQKKVGTVMREFKKGKLHSGKKGPVVKNPKQAIAIALSESGQSKKMMGGMMSDGISNKGSGIEMKSKGGMVRGQGIALRGTKFKGVF